MATNGSKPSATACSCESIARVLRGMATGVEVLHRAGRKHDEAYILSLVEMALGAALHVAAQERAKL